MAVELVWDDSPNCDTIGFSRDLYDKYSLAPTIKELWATAQSSADTVEVNREESVPSQQECSGTDRCQTVNSGSDESAAYPEPRLPFPRNSSLSAREQKLYLRMIMQTKQPEAFQLQLQERVKMEVSEFMKYLQEVAVACAEDYDYLSEGAARYVEEFLRASVATVKDYPQIYHIHEITSLTGGKFKADLSLSFEKQLLVLGKVNIVDLKKPKDVQLAMDYDTVASESPPEKKASQTYAGVSRDPNAEKLCAQYEPHVCLTSTALVQLLDNHGPEYGEAWELPVWVKTTSENGGCPRKVVYVDSPLVKTEMTVREKSSLFHEESMGVTMKRNWLKKASELVLEDPASLPVDEECPRSLVSFDGPEVHFEVDFTDLETFGESSSSSKQLESMKKSNGSSGGVNRTAPRVRGARSLSKASKKIPGKVLSTQPVKESDSSWSDIEEASQVSCPVDVLEPSVSDCPVQESSLTAKRPKWDAAGADSDSEEERLVIDHCAISLSARAAVSVETASTQEQASDTPASPAPDTPMSFSPALPEAPGSSKASRRSSHKLPGSCDQLGKILRMQSVLLKPIASHAPQPMSPPPAAMALPASQSNPQSLVKPCVTSYLEAREGPGSGAAPTALSSSAEPLATAKHKSLLSEQLLAAVDDDRGFQAPKEGNVVYKLYSLQDVLLLVRCSVPFARITKLGNTPNRIVPVHIVPKLEYQLCYGVEQLTKSEVCHLWAHKLLHTTTSSYVGHINAHTSRLFLMELLMADRIRNAPCEFKPAKSLNTLYHLLEKVIGLQEGRYLLSHKAGEPIVTVVKATDGKKVMRATYDLHQAHSDIPQAPLRAPVPWVPVDPSHTLSFHLKHGRVPCTFPPRGTESGEAKGACALQGKGAPVKGPGGVRGDQPGGAKKKKKNKGTRAKRAKKWHQNKNLKQAGRENSKQAE